MSLPSPLPLAPGQRATVGRSSPCASALPKASDASKVSPTEGRGPDAGPAAEVFSLHYDELRQHYISASADLKVSRRSQNRTGSDAARGNRTLFFKRAARLALSLLQ
eukprot:GHVT01001486.1.p2 GENE.GHVT01001486.1~~GHVT01001486.1.p2  ORF type:complete len:107 (-),score=25.29 GHVT01001486.1:416-736(-)